MSFEEFQDGRHGGHLGYWNGTFLAILNLCISPMSPIKFQLNLTWFRRRCRLKNYKMVAEATKGGHLGYRYRTILAILNHCTTVMPPIKLWLNPTYGLGGDVVWRISRWPPWWPARRSERNNFSNSESLCHCDASHQVSAQLDLGFGRRCCSKNFNMAAVVAILYIETERFKQFWISVSLWCLPLSFSLIRLTVWEEMLFEEFQDGRRGVILEIGTERY